MLAAVWRFPSLAMCSTGRDEAIAHGRSSPDTASGPSLLVIEDDTRYSALHEMTFARLGYRVLVAESGGAALHILERTRIDAVILDVSLPGVDGYELCRYIRRHLPVPIIVVSALALEQDKVRGLRAGADDYVTKPFNPNELAARLEAVRRRR